jgi:uncharacterized C2H2 Zn-finger protein
MRRANAVGHDAGAFILSDAPLANASRISKRQEDNAVKCDMCDKEFNNSDELKRHKEEVHPMDERGTPDIDRENPEIKRDLADSEPAEMPDPPEGRTR